MQEFPGNSVNPTGKSERVEQPKKDIQPVTTGEVVMKPKSISRKFRSLFSGGEIRNAGRYIVADVLLPALKNLIVDATSKGVERVVYGENMRRRPGQLGPRVSYNNPNVLSRYAQQPAMLPGQPPIYQRGRTQDVGDILLASKEEAELVLENLSDIIKTYDVASVADLYELVRLPSSHVDHKWGWMTLSHANVRQVREGFLIDLPPAVAI